MFPPSDKSNAIKRAANFFYIIPFADMGILSGSCTTGKARIDSDIDIIVGCRSGRVWTARFLTLLFADVTGKRHKGGESKNKLCLSLFISPGNYRMNDPENDYERSLYPKLKPLFGEKKLIFEFYAENQGIVADGFMAREEFWTHRKKTWLATAIENILGGPFGSRLEAYLRRVQSRKIERYRKKIALGGKNRIILSENRVETHFRVD